MGVISDAKRDNPFSAAFVSLPPTFSPVPGKVLDELDLQRWLSPATLRFTVETTISAGGSLGNKCFFPGVALPSAGAGTGEMSLGGAAYAVLDWKENDWAPSPVETACDLWAFLPLIFSARVRVMVPSDTPVSSYTLTFWKVTMSGVYKLYQMSLSELLSRNQEQASILEFVALMDRYVVVTLSSSAVSAAGGTASMVFEVSPVA